MQKKSKTLNKSVTNREDIPNFLENLKLHVVLLKQSLTLPPSPFPRTDRSDVLPWSNLKADPLSINLEVERIIH